MLLRQISNYCFCAIFSRDLSVCAFFMLFPIMPQSATFRADTKTEKWAGIIPHPQNAQYSMTNCRIDKYWKHKIHQLCNKIFLENLLRSSPKVASSHSHSQFTCKPSIVIYFLGNSHRLMILIRSTSSSSSPPAHLIELANALTCCDVLALATALAIV